LSIAPIALPVAVDAVGDPAEIARSTMTMADLRRQVRFGAYVLDLDARSLYTDGRQISITPKGYELLVRLTENAPNALSKLELAKWLWPNADVVASESLARLVADVRITLGDNGRDQKWIRTVHNFGYAFTTVPIVASGRSALTRHSLVWSDRRYRLKEGENIIGRGAGVAVQIHSLHVSRHHARITVAGECITIEDLGSKNGTHVGDQRLCGIVPLRVGEVIRIGPVTLTLYMTVDVPTPTRQF
jgi:DNA-binding winged helix-turn-helix (wHTH) protein